MSRALLKLAVPCVAVALLLAGDAAHASSNYPAEVQKHLSLSYTPQCALCHANGITGYGTVTTPFGAAMRARGLVCCDISSLDTALDALSAEGNPFINDLKEGIDPNNPNAGAVPPISYGCVTVAGAVPNLGAPLALLLALLVLLSLRRRRPSRLE
jgi:hypothetical protein